MDPRPQITGLGERRPPGPPQGTRHVPTRDTPHGEHWAHRDGTGVWAALGSALHSGGAPKRPGADLRGWAGRVLKLWQTGSANRPQSPPAPLPCGLGVLRGNVRLRAARPCFAPLENTGGISTLQLGPVEPPRPITLVWTPLALSSPSPGVASSPCGRQVPSCDLSCAEGREGTHRSTAAVPCTGKPRFSCRGARAAHTRSDPHGD